MSAPNHPLDQLYDLEALMSRLQDSPKYEEPIRAISEEMIRHGKLLESLRDHLEAFAGQHGTSARIEAILYEALEVNLQLEALIA